MSKTITTLLALAFCLPSFTQRLVIPLGHTGRINDIAVSHDTSRIASADGSPAIIIWDYTTRQQMYPLEGHTSGVEEIECHPHKRILASADKSGKVLLWDERGKILARIHAHSSAVQHILFSPSGDTLFTIAKEPEIKLWDTRSGRSISAISMDIGQPNTLAYSKSKLAVGSTTGEVQIFDLATSERKPPFRISEEAINTLAFEEGTRLLAGTDNGMLVAADLASGSILQNIRAFDKKTYSVLISKPHNLLIAAGRDSKDNLRLFSLDSWKESPVELDAAPGNLGFQLGIEAIASTPDQKHFLVADYQNNIREWNLSKQVWRTKKFTGLAKPVNDFSIDPLDKKLAIATDHSHIKIIDLTGAANAFALAGHPEGAASVDFHPMNPVVVSSGNDDRIRLWNLVTQQHFIELKTKGEYKTLPVRFDQTGRYVIRKNNAKYFDLYAFKKSTFRKLKVKDAFGFHFTKDGLGLVFRSQDQLLVYDPVTLKKQTSITVPGIQDFDVLAGHKLAVLLNDDISVKFLSEDGSRMLNEFRLPDSLRADRIVISPDGTRLFTYRRSLARGEQQADYSINVFDASTGKFRKKLTAHQGYITSVQFLKNGAFMLTSSVDGTIRIWNTDQEKVGTLIPLDKAEYVVTTPEGLFDASPGAMDKLHYVKNGKLIELAQMKSAYYEPELLPKLLGYNREPLRKVSGLGSVNMYPEVEISHPVYNEGRLGLRLTDQGGGIGRVSIIINNKEVSNDIRGAGIVENDNLQISYDITGHPYLLENKVNKITVKAYNKDGTLSSKEKNIYVFSESGDENADDTPKLFAIVAGTSDYAGDEMDLKYAAKDAADFAHALQVSAAAYLGDANTDITLLTTDQAQADLLPTKENITAAFEKYSREAKARDVLVVYLSGHGTNFGGPEGDFYYLTSRAASGNLEDQSTRARVAISSIEFTELIKSVPALKQVMIIDACHSGRLASALATARDVTMSSSQIRALEKMKDRTGLFVLAGSAANAVSYETTLYGQGLLTYSLLFGMKGAALRDNEYIDVMNLFRFAADKVPQLASDIGGIQKPEFRLPEEAKSFDIGRLDEQGKREIQLKAPKPVFVRTQFQEEDGFLDHLELGRLLDEKLKNAAFEKEAQLVFVDDNHFNGAYEVEGRYFTDGLITGEIKLYKDEKLVHSFTKQAANPGLLVSNVYEELMVFLEQQAPVRYK